MSNEIFAKELLKKVRAKKPVVHNITNYVVMNWTANCLLAAGASPIMAHAEEEMESMVDLAHALVINIGTLSTPWIESMGRAMKRAKERGIPIVFDPVGAGATAFRTTTAKDLLRTFPPTVIRGNASEILALTNNAHSSRGVDSAAPSTAAVSAAKALAEQLGCTVCVSGSVDYIVDQTQVIEVHNGHPIMTQVTGMGCAATALIAAFLTVEAPITQATAAAMAITGIAGEQAAKQARGPGTFQALYLDELYTLTNEDLRLNSG